MGVKQFIGRLLDIFLVFQNTGPRSVYLTPKERNSLQREYNHAMSEVVDKIVMNGDPVVLAYWAKYGQSK